MESELNVCWNRCNGDDKRIKQLYFQIAARGYREAKMTDLTCQIEDYLRGLGGSVQTERIDSPIFKIIKRVGTQPGRSLRFQLINNATVLQHPEIKTVEDKKLKNIRYYVPFGYWLDGQETPIIHEQYGPVVQVLFQSYAEGVSLTALTKELIRQSIPNQKEKPAWGHSCIRNILTNPVYLGDKKSPAPMIRELFTQV